MEKSKKVFLIKGEFSWSDVGSWEEVYQLTEKNNDGNSLNGNIYAEELLIPTSILPINSQQL